MGGVGRSAARPDQTVRGFSGDWKPLWASRGGQVSGGEGRRLALARVLLKQSPIVILDEPFTGLDRETVECVCESMAPWLAGRSVLFLLHEIPTPLLVHRTLQL